MTVFSLEVEGIESFNKYVNKTIKPQLHNILSPRIGESHSKKQTSVDGSIPVSFLPILCVCVHHSASPSCFLQG